MTQVLLTHEQRNALKKKSAEQRKANPFPFFKSSPRK